MQVFDDAIVGQNAQLISREGHRQKIIAVFFTGPVRAGLLAQLSAGAAGAGGAVVAIGYIKLGNFAKSADQGLALYRNFLAWKP